MKRHKILASLKQLAPLKMILRKIYFWDFWFLCNSISYIFKIIDKASRIRAFHFYICNGILYKKCFIQGGDKMFFFKRLQFTVFGYTRFRRIFPIWKHHWAQNRGKYGGERGIWTPGTEKTVQQISSLPPSAAQPSLLAKLQHNVICKK